MFDRVLVPLDGSARAEVALKPAASLAGELVLFHSMAASSLEREAAASYLADVARRLGRKDLRVETRLHSGEASRQLAQTVLKDRVDLVVMSGRGQGGGGEGPLGSVAERILRTSPVPVLLIRGAPRIRRVLVPVGEGGPALMALVGEVARPLRAKVALLHPGRRKDAALVTAIDVLTRLGVPVRVCARDCDSDLVAVTDLEGSARSLLRASDRSLLLVRRGA